MTAQCPSDFPYEPIAETSEVLVRQGYWNVAMGLQKVDGLETSRYLRELADEHIQGRYTIAEAGNILREHYGKCSCGKGTQEDSLCEEECREADLVSQRIVELLSRGSFSLMPSILGVIHQELFQDLNQDVYQPGRYKTEALQKSERILNGDSVVYSDPSLIEKSLDYLFGEEGSFAYGFDFTHDQLEHFARFISRVWQVHPFCEGNTRTVAVFAALYLRDLGFDIDNKPFELHSQYFRDALVRANYRNAQAKVLPDIAFVRNFFENLLGGSSHHLDSNNLVVQELFDNPQLLRNVPRSCALKQ